MTELEALVLGAIQGRGRAHGSIVGADVEAIRGRVVGVGSIYKALYRLEAEGFLRAKWEGDDDPAHRGPRRRYYELNALGRSALRDWVRGAERVTTALRPEGAKR
jgi:DNA-binding PadR family transcriptional regulator